MFMWYYFKVELNTNQNDGNLSLPFLLSECMKSESACGIFCSLKIVLRANGHPVSARFVREEEGLKEYGVLAA